MSNDGSFSMKEVVMEIKDDLKAFRIKYDEDQDRRDLEISKRPTWGQMTGLIGGAGVIVTIVVTIVGG